MADNGNKKVEITEREWYLLDRLTENAKMDWFREECGVSGKTIDGFTEVLPAKTIDVANASDAGCAFIRECFAGFSIPELLDIYAFFKRAGVADDCMRNELVEHLQETRQ